jgi:NADH:ubiquinone oxidoreductase subunit 4 (subunit M)
MVKWLKKFMMHYVLYCALLLVLCLGIFPFVVLYTSSMSIAEILDRFSKEKTNAQKLDRLWTVVGTPYDYLVKTVG